MSEDMHGEAGVSLRHLVAEDDEAAAPEVDAARFHGVSGSVGTPRDEVEADPWHEIPRTVRHYLKPDEAHVIPTRLHAALLLGPAAVALCALILATAVNGLLYEAHAASPNAVRVLWFLFAATLGWAAWRWLEWRQTWFIITGHRIMLVQSKRLFGRNVTMLPINKARDVRLVQTVLGRAFRYGTLDFASIGTERALDAVNFLPDPERLYREVCELIMPDTERGTVKRPGAATS